jgi:hypothetical protein
MTFWNQRAQLWIILLFSFNTFWKIKVKFYRISMYVWRSAVGFLTIEWSPVAFKLYVPDWLPVAGKFPSILFLLHATDDHAGTICMRLNATVVQFKCDRLPVACNFCIAIAASTVQICVFFEARARTIIWIKKWGNHLKIWEPTQHVY